MTQKMLFIFWPLLRFCLTHTWGFNETISVSCCFIHDHHRHFQRLRYSQKTLRAFLRMGVEGAWICASGCADDREGVIGHLCVRRRCQSAPQMCVLLKCRRHSVQTTQFFGDRDQPSEPKPDRAARCAQDSPKSAHIQSGRGQKKPRYDSTCGATTFSFLFIVVSWMLEHNRWVESKWMFLIALKNQWFEH